jgi:hypothetical protein
MVRLRCLFVFFLSNLVLSPSTGFHEGTENAISHFHQGRNMLRRGNLEKARLLFQHAVHILPAFADAYYGLGMVEVMKKNPAGAIPPLKKAMALDPANFRVAQNLFMALIDDGNSSNWNEANLAIEKSALGRIALSINNSSPPSDRPSCKYHVYNHWPQDDYAGGYGFHVTPLDSSCQEEIACQDIVPQRRFMVQLVNVFMEYPSGLLYSERKCSFYLGAQHSIMKGFPSNRIFFDDARTTHKFEHPVEVGSIVQTSLHNYYHFITEGIPKLILLLKHAPVTILLLVPDNSFANEALHLLSIPPERIIRYKPNASERYYFDRLYTIDWHRGDFVQSGNPAAEYPEVFAVHNHWHRLAFGLTPLAHYFVPARNVVDTIEQFGTIFGADVDAEEYSDLKKNELPDLCYISRNDSKTRVVLGEYDLLSALRLDTKGGMNVRAIIPGMYTFAQQFKHFKRCSVVVGPHGAGLVNIIWAKIEAPLVMFPLIGELPSSSYYYHLASLQRRTAHFVNTLRSHRLGNYSEAAVHASIAQIGRLVKK